MEKERGTGTAIGDNVMGRGDQHAALRPNWLAERC